MQDEFMILQKIIENEIERMKKINKYFLERLFYTIYNPSNLTI